MSVRIFSPKLIQVIVQQVLVGDSDDENNPERYVDYYFDPEDGKPLAFNDAHRVSTGELYSAHMGDYDGTVPKGRQ